MKELNVVFTFFLLLNVCLVQGQSFSAEKESERLDSISKNPSKGIYFIDKVEVPELTFFRKLFDDEIESSGYGWTGKEAIIRFGERYRYGINFFELKIKKDLALLPPDRYILRGSIGPSFNNRRIVLFSFIEDRITRVDTSLIEGGRFTFSGKENGTDIGILCVGNYPDTVVSQIVILERGDIDVSLESHRTSGTKLNDLFQEYKDSVASYVNKINELDSLEHNTERILDKKYSSYRKQIELGRYTVGFKRKNIDNVVGRYYFEKEAGKRLSEGVAFPSVNDTDSAFCLIYQVADSAYKQKKWIKEYIAYLKKVDDKKQKAVMPFVDLALMDCEGKICHLSDYIGKSKFLLLDFWASWCAPCLAGFPN